MFLIDLCDGFGLRERRGRAALHPSARFRPQVEALEDRTVASSTTLAVAPNPATPEQLVTLAATATGVVGDPLSNVVRARFEFYADGRLLGERSQHFQGRNPVSTVSDQLTVSLPVGTHTLSVRLVNLNF